jgi:hypothetical protein
VKNNRAPSLLITDSTRKGTRIIALLHKNLWLIFQSKKFGKETLKQSFFQQTKKNRENEDKTGEKNRIGKNREKAVQKKRMGSLRAIFIQIIVSVFR